MTITDTTPDRHPICECGCCGPAAATAVMEPPDVEVKEAAAVDGATCRCECGCTPDTRTGDGCECGCTDSGCDCGCGSA